MSKPTTLALLGVLFALAITSSSSAATDESNHTVGAYVSISKGKAGIKKLTHKVADRDHAVSYLVFNCTHPGHDAGLVRCAVRLRFKDTDGTTGFTRYTGTATARKTTLAPR